MKAVCIVGSPRANGNTTRIANEILKGLHDQDIEVTLLSLSNYNIHYCIGCKSCFRTGECVQDDDVKLLINIIYESDLVIIASPSYWGDVTAQMKTFIDRCTPFCNNNPSKKIKSNCKRGIAIAVRAGNNKKENDDLVHTIEHFLGHHDIPLVSSFTVEGIDTEEDLEKNHDILNKAYEFGKCLKIH